MRSPWRKRAATARCGISVRSTTRRMRLSGKLAGRYQALHFCCEAGLMGHGLYWQILPYDGSKTTVSVTSDTVMKSSDATSASLPGQRRLIGVIVRHKHRQVGG